MKIEEAVNKAREGNYITRKNKRHRGYVIYLTILNIFFVKDKDEPYHFNYSDFIADDWEVWEK